MGHFFFVLMITFFKLLAETLHQKIISKGKH